MNTINLKGFDPNPKALLQTLNSSSTRRAEIKDLQKHMDHLLNTHKAIPAHQQFRLNSMVETLEHLDKGFSELTIWSLDKINIGDTIDIEFLNRRFAVSYIESVSNHKGRFINPLHAENTFYVLYGKVSFINEPKTIEPKTSKK